MKAEQLVYYTEPEFMVLMEFAGDAPYSLPSTYQEPTDGELAQALFQLSRRGLLKTNIDGPVLLGDGNEFIQMRTAPLAVVLTAYQPDFRQSLCYAKGEAVWIAELLAERGTRMFRLRCFDLTGLSQWLFQAGYLNEPELTERDAGELNATLRKQDGPQEETLLFRMEKYRNGGKLLASYELGKGWAGRWLRKAQEGSTILKIFTKESWSETFVDCFYGGSI